MHPGSEAEGRKEPTRPSILLVDPGMVVSEAVALVVSRQAHVLRATTGMGGLTIAAERAVTLVRMKPRSSGNASVRRTPSTAAGRHSRRP